jgi:hypothetical protein
MELIGVTSGAALAVSLTDGGSSEVLSFATCSCKHLELRRRVLPDCTGCGRRESGNVRFR